MNEFITDQNELYLDGSHNPDAAYNINRSIKLLPKKDLCIIIGMLNTKDPLKYIKQFDNILEIKTIKIIDEINSLSAEKLCKTLSATKIKCSNSDSIDKAIIDLVDSNPNARILICGSFYLVGQVLKQSKVSL